MVSCLFQVCDDHQREALLTRIKQHLHNLKKYTYGKHIVARVEKLITNTQRLIRNSSASLAHGPESSAQPEQQPLLLTYLSQGHLRMLALLQKPPHPPQLDLPWPGLFKLICEVLNL